MTLVAAPPHRSTVHGSHDLSDDVPDTATVSTLGWELENRVVRYWNEACHLRSMDPVL